MPSPSIETAPRRDHLSLRLAHQSEPFGNGGDVAAAEPDEITRLVLFVASREASFSTGPEFIGDGGPVLGPVPDASPRA